MKISLYDEFCDVVWQNLKDTSKESIRTAAIAVYGDYEGVTIGRVMEIAESGDLSCVFGSHFRNTWGQVVWMMGLRDFIQELPETLLALTPKMDADEKQASEGLMDSTLAESLLVFARNYFGLHSFTDAERITIGEVLIAKKATYNEQMFQKKLSKIRLEKAKRNTRK